MTVALHSSQFGPISAPKLVILHGLMGSSRNWLMVARALSTKFNVHVLDLRNHGQSPWEESMEWDDLTADLVQYCDREFKNQAIGLIGHSLGGKCAMHMSMRYPDRVDKLVVVDIVAKRYAPHFKKEFQALLGLRVESLTSRQEALTLLEEAIPDPLFRESLLANLKRNSESEHSGFAWQPNIAVLYKHLESIRTNPLRVGDRFSNRMLLIKGEQSNFVEEADLSQMQTYFPKLEYSCMEGAGHNPHIDSKEAFLRILFNWL